MAVRAQLVSPSQRRGASLFFPAALALIALLGSGATRAADQPDATASTPVAAANSAVAIPAAATGDVPVVIQGLDSNGTLTLSINRSVVLVTGSRLRNADVDGAAVTVGSADIVSVQPLTPTSLLVTAKKTGSTNLIIEDEFGRRQLIEVRIEDDLEAIRSQLKSLNPQASIQADNDNGTIVLRGRVPSLKVADQAAQVAGAFAGGSGKVANLLEVSGGQQVMLQVKFAEVSKQAVSQLGVNFGYTDGESYFASNLAGINPYTLASSSLFAANPLAAAPPSAAVQLFGNIEFERNAITYFLNALHQNQLMRTLAEPDLIAISGQQASFQVGGQIPIPVPQQSSGSGSSSSTITIQYENYGVMLNFTPIVLGDGRIRLNISPEVSDLDYAHGVSFGGFTIPGFTTRTVNTTVELADGQTFMIAGLLNDQTTATTNGIPGLGNLPILGQLFSSVQYQRNQTELVVMVTPRLVEGLNPDQVPAVPGEHWRFPTEADLFLWRDLGGEATATPPAGPATTPSVSSTTPPPMFHGHYGFSPTAQTNVLEQ